MRRTLLLITPIILVGVGWLSADGVASDGRDGREPGVAPTTTAAPMGAVPITSAVAAAEGQGPSDRRAAEAATGPSGGAAGTPPPTERVEDRTVRVATHLPADATGDQPESAALAAEIGDPANSDVPAGLFAALSAMGADVVVADTTGVGRDAFPDYWAGARASHCCTQVTVHAAGAHRDPSRAEAVVVSVLWSAWSQFGDPLGDLSVVHLTEVDGTWRPERPETAS